MPLGCWQSLGTVVGVSVDLWLFFGVMWCCGVGGLARAIMRVRATRATALRAEEGARKRREGEVRRGEERLEGWVCLGFWRGRFGERYGDGGLYDCRIVMYSVPVWYTSTQPDNSPRQPSSNPKTHLTSPALRLPQALHPKTSSSSCAPKSLPNPNKITIDTPFLHPPPPHARDPPHHPSPNLFIRAAAKWADFSSLCIAFRFRKQ
jgi:hypothetical protein